MLLRFARMPFVPVGLSFAQFETCWSQAFSHVRMQPSILIWCTLLNVLLGIDMSHSWYLKTTINFLDGTHLFLGKDLEADKDHTMSSLPCWRKGLMNHLLLMKTYCRKNGPVKAFLRVYWNNSSSYRNKNLSENKFFKLYWSSSLKILVKFLKP